MAEINLSKYGITGTTEIVHNPSYELLFEEETKAGLEGFEKGQVSELGAVNVMTGVYTGRSPKDKFIVVDENSKDTVWWTSDEYKNDNHPASQEAWELSLIHILTGMMKREKKIPVGYIPTGTTNDFASSLHIPKNLLQAASTAAGGKEFPCDIGRFNGDVFVYIAAFGLFTDVSYETKQEMKMCIRDSPRSVPASLAVNPDRK